MPLPGVTVYFRWRELAAVKPPGMHPMVITHHVFSQMVKTHLGELPDYGPGTYQKSKANASASVFLVITEPRGAVVSNLSE